jgi:hypothetical protein
MPESVWEEGWGNGTAERGKEQKRFLLKKRSRRELV